MFPRCSPIVLRPLLAREYFAATCGTVSSESSTGNVLLEMAGPSRLCVSAPVRQSRVNFLDRRNMGTVYRRDCPKLRSIPFHHRLIPKGWSGQYCSPGEMRWKSSIEVQHHRAPMPALRLPGKGPDTVTGSPRMIAIRVLRPVHEVLPWNKATHSSALPALRPNLAGDARRYFAIASNCSRARIKHRIGRVPWNWA